MATANDVRAFCIETYVQPARAKKEIGFFIRSGDVHKAMRLSNRYPLVCSAIRSAEFENAANAKRIYGSSQDGAKIIFAFLLNEAVCGE